MTFLQLFSPKLFSFFTNKTLMAMYANMVAHETQTGAIVKQFSAPVVEKTQTLNVQAEDVCCHCC